MWQRSFGTPPPAVWPVAVGFPMSLVVAATMTALHSTNEPTGVALLVVGVIGCSVRARPAAAIATGVIAWLFDNGFLAHTTGDLHWRGTADTVAIAVLVGSALLSARLSAALGHRRGPAPAAPAPPTAPSRAHQEVGAGC
jgi:K+-sensing histidine kinase KdpD